MADFQTKNPNLGQFWWDLQVAMEAIGVFCGNLVYFMVIWYILWQFGIFYGYLVYFFPFWDVVPRKIWQS
jgi:hypothetical protein